MKTASKLMILMLLSLYLLTACSSSGEGRLAATKTGETKGGNATTSPFSTTSRLVLYFTDQEEAPLSGAEITYSYKASAGKDAVDEMLYIAGTTDQNGRLEIEWADSEWDKIAFYIVGKDSKHSGTIECLITRENVKHGMILSLKDSQ